MINPYIAPHLAEMPLPRVLIRSVECLLLAEVPFERPLLDIGAGDGHFASALFTEPVDVGVDIDQAPMREAQKRGSYRNLIQASATRLPFPDGCFRTVMCNSTFEHIPEVESALAEAGRVLAPRGLLLTTMPSQYFNRYMLPVRVAGLLRVNSLGERYLRWFNRRARHFHLEPPEVWIRWFEAAGFEVVRWRYYFPPSSHTFFELAHYVSIPSLLVKRLLGRWVLWPGKARFKPLLWAVNQAARLGPPDTGAGIFFICQRVAPAPEKRHREPVRPAGTVHEDSQRSK